MLKHSHQSTINDTLFRKKRTRGIPLVEQEQPLEEGIPRGDFKLSDNFNIPKDYKFENSIISKVGRRVNPIWKLFLRLRVQKYAFERYCTYCGKTIGYHLLLLHAWRCPHMIAKLSNNIHYQRIVGRTSVVKSEMRNLYRWLFELVYRYSFSILDKKYFRNIYSLCIVKSQSIPETLPGSRVLFGSGTDFLFPDIQDVFSATVPITLSFDVWTNRQHEEDTGIMMAQNQVEYFLDVIISGNNTVNTSFLFALGREST